MTDQERIAHGVSESFWIEQALIADQGIPAVGDKKPVPPDPEYADMFYETAKVHAAAAWATADMAEVVPLPVSEETPLEAAA